MDTVAYDDSFDDFEGKNSINKTPTNNKSNKKSKPLLSIYHRKTILL